MDPPMTQEQGLVQASTSGSQIGQEDDHSGWVFEVSGDQISARRTYDLGSPALARLLYSELQCFEEETGEVFFKVDIQGTLVSFLMTTAKPELKMVQRHAQRVDRLQAIFVMANLYKAPAVGTASRG